ncbi:MAG: tetratricopeptide repeat protein, partial [Proteobacteria bacterium]|nr:tetratricopeptide repeat protein [Pseudomonadota bacterium]
YTPKDPPRGFFDDLPAQPPRTPAATPASRPPPKADERAAAKGFFDDVPHPTPTHDKLELAFDDVPHDAVVPELDLELASPSTGGLIDTAPYLPSSPTVAASSAPAPAKATPANSAAFDDLDLSAPSTPQALRANDQRQAAAKTPAPARGGSSPSSSAASPRGGGQAAELELELEPARDLPKGVSPTRPDRVDAAKVDAKPKKKRNPKVLAGIAAGILALGGGGAFFYQRHAAAQAQADEVDGLVKTARAALTATDATHWQRAATNATKAIDLDDKAAAAYGIAAEASLAGALEDGVNAPARLLKGRKLIGQALEANVAAPELERAKALQQITTANPQTDLLERLHAATPGDANVTMYLAWGQAAKGDHASAIKTFDALVGTPLERSAIYHRGRSKLALSDLPGATTDFTAVLAKAHDHIGAMVGLAAALPPASLAQQEADLTAIMNRKDFGTADPRVRVLANVLLGDAAQRAGRLDVARKHYRDALAIADSDVLASTGLAEVELRDNKIDAAKELVEKAVRLAPNDVRAQLAASELSVRRAEFRDAEQRLSILSQRTPPLAPLEQARLLLITGELHEMRGENDPAVDSYVAGAKIAGDLDLAPMTAAVRKLSELAAEAATDDPKRAADYKARADALLSALVEKAKADPALALSLGIAYLQAGDATKAEPLLRQAAEARPNDSDPIFQLAKALAQLDKLEDAIVQLKKAMEIAPDRIEIGFELAQTYEHAARDTEATELYGRLLKTKDVAIEMRGHACRFFARMPGQNEKERADNVARAASEGNAIYKLDPRNAAGLYCKGEGELYAKRADEARKLFQQAVQADATAQYLDAQGRAAELLVEQSSDTKFQDEAIRVYQLAHSAAPRMLNPLVGQGRIRLARKEYAAALEVLIPPPPVPPAPKLVGAWELHRDDPEIAYLIGRALYEQQNKPKAIEWLAVANKLQPRADTAWRLGQLYFDAATSTAAYGPAKETLRQAIDLANKEIKSGTATATSFPWLVEAYYSLGYLEDTSGNLAGAKDAWEKYLAQNPPQGPQLNSVKTALATRLKGQ